ncbi:hypothetical protein [Streptomyces prunicolor]|uniref:hypothetical protein n=1 Tax=Streptomyces prunicolor TaxID=67348 RepID=UPI000375C7C9|nr:hypothetical protein [Streptomyces prunicolor]
MNGWAFGAVVVVCLTVAVVAVAWALVRSGSRTDGSVSTDRGELSADEEFEAVQAHNRAGQAALREQIAAATERARREREGGF